jgi:hypothetical protein
LGDAFTGFVERDAFALIQRSQSVLDGLTELKLVNSVNQSCVGRKLLRHFQENLFRAHASIVYIILNSPPTIPFRLRHPAQPARRGGRTLSESAFDILLLG